MTPLVSVVTVCLNAESIIEKTIESVLMQNSMNFEYLIIDGKSNDNTLDIAESFRDKLKKKGILYYIYSEKDTGIYNAMNKAARKATGKYIIFMNAGDVFYSPNVLMDFEKAVLLMENPIAVYGNTVMKNQNLYYAEISVINDKDFILTHQSVFTLSEYLKEHPYEETYRYAADSDYYMQLFKKNISIKKINCFVSIFDTAGVSASREGEKELKFVREKNGYEKALPLRRKIKHEMRRWMPNFVTRYYDKKNGWKNEIPKNADG